MRTLVQVGLFVALAGAVHLGLALGWQRLGPAGARSAGAQGEALVTLQAAPSAYSTLAEAWDRPPEAGRAPPRAPAPAPDDAPAQAVQRDAAPAHASATPAPPSSTPPPDAPPEADRHVPAPAAPQVVDSPASAPAPAPAADAADAAPRAPAPSAEAPPAARAEPTVPPSPASPAGQAVVAERDVPALPPEVTARPAGPEQPRPRARPRADDADDADDSAAPAAAAAPTEARTARGRGGGQTAGDRGTQRAATLSDAERDRLVAGWGAAIRAAVERHKRPPADRAEGTATIAMEIDRQGRLRAAGLARGSGHDALDRAALDSVRRAAPFPPAPEALRASSYRFNLPVSFRLR